MISTGNNIGNVLLLSNEGRKIMDLRLHKKKVTHTEFSPREDWLLCTASTDQTVQLWDVRMIKDRKSALQILKHDKPVNSAYFSLTDGTRLLTTDQESQIRVYQAPDFKLETTIQHPYRFFQHITPIKAYWHPLQDLIVVGRYPDPNFPGYVDGEKRTIDVFDASSGQMVCQLSDPAAPGIVSLNKFNHSGDLLASGMGVNILIWSRKEEMIERQQALMDAMKKSGIGPGSGAGGNSLRPGNRPGRRGADEDTDDLKKKKKGNSKTKNSTDKQTASKLKQKTKKKKVPTATLR